MMVHDRPGRTSLIDFFVAAPGLRRDRARRRAGPGPRPLRRETIQTFHVGPASCGVPGHRRRARARARALRLDAARGAGRRRRPPRPRGRPGQRQQAYILEILAPIHDRAPRSCASSTRRTGGSCARATSSASPSWPTRSSASPPRAPSRSTGARSASAIADFVRRARRHARRAPTSPPTRRSSGSRSGPRSAAAEVLTNPPPSSGGILIAYASACWSGSAAAAWSSWSRRWGPPTRRAARASPRPARARLRSGASSTQPTRRLAEGLRRGPSPPGRDLPADLLGSTTHISVARRRRDVCASVTCSNGSGSGVLVPGTGVILNNMLGEEDLNPLGFHRDRRPAAGSRSMMAPTVVLRDGEIDRGPRQRRLQPDPLGDPADGRAAARARGMGPAAAVEAPRLHFEQGIVQAEPGVDEDGAAPDRGARACRSPAGAPEPLLRRRPGRRPRPGPGALSGGGDPRRGGAVAVA